MRDKFYENKIFDSIFLRNQLVLSLIYEQNGGRRRAGTLISRRDKQWVHFISVLQYPNRI